MFEYYLYFIKINKNLNINSLTINYSIMKNKKKIMFCRDIKVIFVTFTAKFSSIEVCK